MELYSRWTANKTLQDIAIGALMYINANVKTFLFLAF